MAQMLDPEFEAMLDAAVEDAGVAPDRLELEITESIAMHSPELVSRRLQRLRSRGIAIAIDDFGTGFSSLAYLERLAVDRSGGEQPFAARLERDGWCRWRGRRGCAAARGDEENDRDEGRGKQSRHVRETPAGAARLRQAGAAAGACSAARASSAAASCAASSATATGWSPGARARNCSRVDTPVSMNTQRAPRAFAAARSVRIPSPTMIASRASRPTEWAAISSSRGAGFPIEIGVTPVVASTAATIAPAPGCRPRSVG